MERSNRQELITKGKRAEALLEDPLLREALIGMKEQWLKDIEHSEPDEQDKREHRYLLLKVREDFVRYLGIAVERGIMAEQEIQH